MFDLLVLRGRDIMDEPLERRRGLLDDEVLSLLRDPVRTSRIFEAKLSDLILAVRQQGLEGVVAKSIDSRYEPGLRSGAWQKMRLNLAQAFEIAGYTPGLKNFDALIFGYYEGDKLMYAARTRNGFTPRMRDELYAKLRSFEIPDCPFVNLPESGAGRWGQGLTAEKMKECRWLKPITVAQFGFVE